MDKAHHIGICSMAPVPESHSTADVFHQYLCFHTTFSLRRAIIRNIQLFRQSFQRTGNGTNLFLTATKCHTTRIHQLKVVNNNDSHSMFTYQTTRFGPEFEYRQRDGVSST